MITDDLLIQNSTMQNTQFVIHRTEKANSYEFGKAGNRFKIFFDSTDDLFKQIQSLKALGLLRENEDEDNL